VLERVLANIILKKKGHDPSIKKVKIIGIEYKKSSIIFYLIFFNGFKLKIQRKTTKKACGPAYIPSLKRRFVEVMPAYPVSFLSLQ